jgi:outer membrane receptor for ferrienterochelin and colicins
MRFSWYAALALAFLCVFTGGIKALAESSPLTGTVVAEDGSPVIGAQVRVSGQNITMNTTTDNRGRFAFQTLNVGDYRLTVTKAELQSDRAVELTSGGVDLNIALVPLKVIGHAVVVRNPSPVRSGTDVTLNSTLLAHMAGSGSMPNILTQLPSAARGSNGQIHINGDHNGLNYYVDGVQLPTNLNRVVGNEIDPSNIGFMDALEGAYPAQYGDRFAAVLNIGTRVYTGPPGAYVDAAAGSFGYSSATLGYHTMVGNGGSFSLTSSAQRTDRALDPPVPDPVHNAGSNTNNFLRLSLPMHQSDTLNLDVMQSLQTFQIPPDTRNGVPDSTDDNEYQSDTFVTLQYRHAVGEHGSLSFGPSFKSSRITDTNDLANDLAGSGLSLFADTRSRDAGFNVDYDLRSEHHDVRAGAVYGATIVPKNYAIYANSNTPFVDTSTNVGHSQEAYVQDSWQMGPLYRLDYGLRMDAFQVFSDSFDRGFNQWSPRVKLTRLFGPRASVYAYYGRLFEPFSLQSVAPLTAAEINGSTDIAAFDLRPERDSLYEFGGHVAVGSADVGVRISRRSATDWIDDTQVGATNLHQEINFPVGRAEVQSLYVQQPLARGGRTYFSLTRSIAQNSLNCETQLLQDCAADGPAGGQLVQADHDQRWDSSAGFVFPDARGGWFSASAEYGSGLSMDPSNCTTQDPRNCKVPPHLTFNAQKGFAIGNGLQLSVGVTNLLNDRYAITLDNALQGTHYAMPRAIQVELRTAQR